MANLQIKDIPEKTLKKLDDLAKISIYNKKILVIMAIDKLKLSNNDLK